MGIVADDDVVVEGDVELGGGGGEFGGELDVVGGRRWVTTGVIMNHNNGKRAVLKRFFDHFARVDGAGVDCAGEEVILP